MVNWVAPAVVAEVLAMCLVPAWMQDSPARQTRVVAVVVVRRAMAELRTGLISAPLEVGAVMALSTSLIARATRMFRSSSAQVQELLEHPARSM